MAEDDRENTPQRFTGKAGRSKFAGKAGRPAADDKPAAAPDVTVTVQGSDAAPLAPGPAPGELWVTLLETSNWGKKAEQRIPPERPRPPVAAETPPRLATSTWPLVETRQAPEVRVVEEVAAPPAEPPEVVETALVADAEAESGEGEAVAAPQAEPIEAVAAELVVETIEAAPAEPIVEIVELAPVIDMVELVPAEPVVETIEVAPIEPVVEVIEVVPVEPMAEAVAPPADEPVAETRPDPVAEPREPLEPETLTVRPKLDIADLAVAKAVFSGGASRRPEPAAPPPRAARGRPPELREIPVENLLGGMASLIGAGISGLSTASGRVVGGAAGGLRKLASRCGACTTSCGK